MRSTQSSFATGNSNKSSAEGFIDKVAVWRTKFAGRSIQKDGQTWTWCNHHKQPGKWDDLYWKDHNTASHADWKKQPDKQKKKQQENTSANTSNSAQATGEQKKLTISDKLCSALATNIYCLEEDIDPIVKDQESGN